MQDQDKSGDHPPAVLLNRRYRVYPLIIFFAYVIAAIVYTTSIAGDSVYDLLPDYVAFFVASEFADSGSLARIYDTEVARAAQAALNGKDLVAPWFYPPTYSLIIFWLPWLPYYAGAALFLTLSLAFFLTAVRTLFTDATDLWIVLAAPACYINAFHGQNGFLTAGLAALILNSLAKRQVRAGVALGLLTVKPHLGILMPIVLLARRRWSAITVGFGTALALCILSLALYGPDPWNAFVQTALISAGDHIAQGTLPITMNSSALAAFELAGLPDKLAFGLHLMVIAAIAVAIIHLVRIGAAYRFVMAFLLAATLLASPHNFVYDWTIVLLPMLILWREGRKSGFLRYEQAGLIVTYFAPFMIVFTRHLGIPTATFAVLIPVALAWRRAAQSGG